MRGAACMLAAALALSATHTLTHTHAADVPQEFTHTRATRKILANKHVVAANTTFTIKGLSAASRYYLAFPTEEAAKFVYVSALTDGESVPVAVDTSVQKDGFTHYVVRFKKAITSSDSQTLTVTTVSAGVLRPVPAQIDQAGIQLVVYDFNAYIPTPYHTEKQSTTVQLASARVEDYSRNPSPITVEGARLKAGQYSDIAGYSVAPAFVHSENAHPFATMSSVLREVEVSHWGNVAVEEHYTMRHAGAALKQGFSRIDYQMRNAKAASFNSLMGTLPKGATDVYYRDIIGNISTSHVRSGKDATVLEIETRFPLFGGWKTEWYQGYNVPASPYVTTNDDGSFTMTFDANIPYPEVPIEDYTLKVVLPEGANIESISAPFPHTATHSSRFTYLDGPFSGRAIAVVKATGTIVSSGTHTGNVQVTYRLPPFSLAYKLGYLVVAFLLVFALFSITSRLDLSLGPRAQSQAASKGAKQS